MEGLIVKKLLHFCNVAPKKCIRIIGGEIDFFDFTFVLKGQMEYIVNSKSVIIRENDAILLTPGTRRSRPIGDTEVHYVSFNFTTDVPELIPNSLYYQNIVTREMRALTEVFSNQHISPLYHSREKTVCILNCLLWEFIDAVSLGSGDRNVTAVLKFINENLTKKITLSDIGTSVHLSPDYVSHIFKKELGRSVMDYVNERRMRLARSMVKSGEVPLGEVAAALGYDSYSYFSRVFKRYFGVSPVKYK